jgi:hypothetical protein
MNKFEKEYHLRRYHKTRQRYVEALGGKCVKCDTTENLEFDHINPVEKTYEINKIINRKENFVLLELAKCQLLCEVCHLEKTVSEKTPSSHGSMRTWMHKKCQCVTCMKSKQKYYIVRNERRRKKTKGARGPYSKDPSHGTSAKYKRGCKCELCRKANAEKARLQKQTRKRKLV